MGDFEKVYSKGVKVEGKAPAPEVTPLKVYLGVFGILIALTVLTVLVSEWGLGRFALGVAMLVAGAKAAFVVTYFMHLKQDRKFFTFIFLTSVAFVGLFFSFTFIDLETRDTIEPTWGTQVYAEDAGLLDRPELENIKPIEKAED